MKKTKKTPAATRVAAGVSPQEDDSLLPERRDVADHPPELDEEDFSFSAPAQSPQMLALKYLQEGLKVWRPAREVLTKVRAVKTIFVQYDRATRCGGHPIERFCTVHGPSGHGKTSFVHGIGLSFLQQEHVYGYVDAEYTTPEDWLDKLMAEYASSPAFLAMRPDSYEQTVNASRNLLKSISALREAKEGPRLNPGTCCLLAVDSMRKLVPEDILAKILKLGAEGDKGSVDGMGGRAAQIKAAMNASWLDELTPLLAKTGNGMIVIARESEDAEADANDRKYDRAYKVGGGKSVVYDSSLLLRITEVGKVREGSKEESQVVGKRHKITIRKTKVSGQDDENTYCFFHTSNGVLVPEGFDRARDVLELARAYRIVEGDGWLSWKARSLRCQGVNQMVRKLTAVPEALADLEAEVRARFSSTEALPTEGKVDTIEPMKG